MEFFDPHFHIWDLTPASTSGHDARVLHECPWVKGDAKFYGAKEYEADCDGSAELKHVGGVFIDAMSVCHVDKPASWLQDKCLAEARWVAAQLGASERLYRYAPSACLEDPNVAETLKALAAIPGVVGIRQILNHEPSWPRNAVLGDLLDNEQWRGGYPKLAEVGFSFDMQLNPPQYAKAAAFVAQHPDVPVIINHLGTPTAADLGEKVATYWAGLEALAALPHVSIKISMLCYADKAWGQSDAVVDAVGRVIKLFGDERCCFASNYPVDFKDEWPASRLYPAMLGLAAKLGLNEEQKGKLFAANAKRLYRACA